MGTVQKTVSLGRTGENDFARDEDEENNARLNHAIDEAREELRLVRGKLRVREVEALEVDREVHVARAHHVLDLELAELRLRECGEYTHAEERSESNPHYSENIHQNSVAV